MDGSTVQAEKHLMSKAITSTELYCSSQTNGDTYGKVSFRVEFKTTGTMRQIET